MTAARCLPLWLLALAVPAAAQFTLAVEEPSGGRTAPALYDLGSTYAGGTLSARFQLRNTSAAAASVTIIKAAGAGFTTVAPPLPAAVEPGAAVEFTVAFSAPDVGHYSAVLSAANVTILLTATVAPSLTWRVEGAPLGPGVDFGSTPAGTTVRRQFTVLNATPGILMVPAMSVSGAGFALEGTPPGGTALLPQHSAGFTVAFTPPSAGTFAALLLYGDRATVLTGTGLEPPLPPPVLSVDLPQAASGQQGTLVVTFASPLPIAASGTATLDFRGSWDPSITFASGGRSATFSLAAGDTRVVLPFQTGTTAGTIVFGVTLGSDSASLTVPIPAAPPSFTQLSGSRTAAGVEVGITGWDNTHAVSQAAFTFYDSAGKPIAPGALRVDVSGDFSRYFAGSDAGGAFTLRADFPVSGDAAQISSYDVSLTGPGGTTKSARTAIQ